MFNTMIVSQIIILNVLNLYAIVPVIAETIKYFKIDRITNCEPADQFPVTLLPDYNINNKPNENSFNCTLRIKEEIEGPLKVRNHFLSGSNWIFKSIFYPLQYQANIKRCEMDLSKCEFFNTIETDELCDYFKDAGFKERFLNSVSQSIMCPIKAGDYQFTNTKWDMSAIVNLPGSAYRWNIVTKLTQMATGRTVYCIEMMARIVVIRKKANRI
ncbi:uncharacterized protein LOC125760615 [Anopheles funestus]|uniref:uncharacterized protein LOC125760615 n=1 Tax=Anopheles funestus TaxID=62324 RepID=UPI0020C63EB8|nr:uncharacterized protein LOC125760615 [Anopheles funestus]